MVQPWCMTRKSGKAHGLFPVGFILPENVWDATRRRYTGAFPHLWAAVFLSPTRKQGCGQIPCLRVGLRKTRRTARRNGDAPTLRGSTYGFFPVSFSGFGGPTIGFVGAE